MSVRTLLSWSYSPVLLLALWELCARGNVIDARFFPAPSSIFYYLLFISPQAGLWDDLRASLWRIAVGYSGGVILGIAVGTAMGMHQGIRRFVYPLMTLLYPVPKIAILPLVMLVFGIGDLSKIVVIGLGSFFLVLANTLHGIDTIARLYFDVAAVFDVRRRHMLTHIVLPGALPSIFTGLRLAIGYSMVVMVAAEISGAQAGLGYVIWQSWETFEIKTLYAYVFVLGFLGLIFTLSLDALQRYWLRWLPSPMRTPK